jgi:hypothetical protein
MLTGSAPASARTLQDRLSRFDGWLLKQPWMLLVVAIVLISLLKHGPRFLSGFSSDALNLPGFTGQNGPVIFEHTLAFARLVGVTHVGTWTGLSFILLVGMQLTMGVVLFRRFQKRDALVIFGIIVIGQLGLMMTNQFGREDMFLIFGSFVVVFARRKSWLVWSLGSALMVLSNSGQALFAAVSLGLLSIYGPFSQFRVRTATLFGMAALWLVLEQIFAPGNTQVDLFSVLLRDSLNASLYTVTLRVASIFGAAWILVLLFLMSARGLLLVIAIFTFVIMPVTMTLVTLDGTRVGVGMTALILMALLRVGIPPALKGLQEANVPVVTLTLVAFLVFPTINVFFYSIEVPWTWLIGLLNPAPG